VSATDPPVDEAALEERLSRPTPALVAEIAGLEGDLVMLGAGGKMGPTLAVMARRALTAAGRHDVEVIAVSRWSDRAAAARVRALGVRTQVMDLGVDTELSALPDAAALVYLIGAKFGSSAQPHVAWTTNAVLPALLARRYPAARIVALSTGNVYPLVPVDGPGADETSPLGPVGEYAMSCVGRERAFEAASALRGTATALIRLNYAVELRYGVLTDLAERVRSRIPIALDTSHANVVWAGYVNEVVLRMLGRVSSPPTVLNVTGVPAVSVRAVADRLGELLGIEPSYVGAPAPTALLSDARRCVELFGAPEVDEWTLLRWQADWFAAGHPVWAKATKFERRDGKF
jgi:hypothetical protein